MLEPNCLKQCNKVVNDGITTCLSCGKVFGISQKYSSDPINISDQEVLTEDERIGKFIEDQPSLIKMGVESNILDKEKIKFYTDEYKKRKD